MIRHRLKIWSVRDNARAALSVIEEHGSLDAWLWAFVDGQPIVNRWREPGQVPATTEISDRMSKALRKRGFRFVGSTICYAFMQATGMVDDHLTTCTVKERFPDCRTALWIALRIAAPFSSLAGLTR